MNSYKSEEFIVRSDREIDITDTKLDFIFNSLSIDNYNVYFVGWHLDFVYKIEIKEELTKLIINLSCDILINSCDHSKLLFKIKKIDRKELNKLWHFYEYPSIFFLRSHRDELKLTEIFDKNSRKISFENGFCHLYKIDPEVNVLRGEKSIDINFNSISNY